MHFTRKKMAADKDREIGVDTIGGGGFDKANRGETKNLE